MSFFLCDLPNVGEYLIYNRWLYRVQKMTRFIFSDKVWKFIIKPPTPNKSLSLGFRRSPGLKRVEKNYPYLKKLKKWCAHKKYGRRESWARLKYDRNETITLLNQNKFRFVKTVLYDRNYKQYLKFQVNQ